MEKISAGMLPDFALYVYASFLLCVLVCSGPPLVRTVGWFWGPAVAAAWLDWVDRRAAFEPTAGGLPAGGGRNDLLIAGLFVRESATHGRGEGSLARGVDGRDERWCECRGRSTGGKRQPFLCGSQPSCAFACAQQTSGFWKNTKRRRDKRVLCSSPTERRKEVLAKASLLALLCKGRRTWWPWLTSPSTGSQVLVCLGVGWASVVQCGVCVGPRWDAPGGCSPPPRAPKRAPVLFWALLARACLGRRGGVASRCSVARAGGGRRRPFPQRKLSILRRSLAKALAGGMFGVGVRGFRERCAAPSNLRTHYLVCIFDVFSDHCGRVCRKGCGIGARIEGTCTEMHDSSHLITWDGKYRYRCPQETGRQAVWVRRAGRCISHTLLPLPIYNHL